MAFQLFLSVLWIVAASRLVAAATLFNLSSETTAFIPTCARDCFISFLTVNYAPSTCGTSPSLQCLCANEGVSGYTIGEGAVQCIVAENSIGFCKGYDVSSGPVQRAYRMCSSQPGAVTPSHAAIVATLIVPQSGTGRVQVPPPLTTRTVTSLQTTTRFVTTSLSSSTAVAAPSSSTAPPILQPTEIVIASPQASLQPAESSSDNSSLGTAQVAGISVGVAAAVGIALGAILLARRRRQQNYPDEPTAFFPGDRKRDSWDMLNTHPANVFHISPPVMDGRTPTPTLTPPPALYQPLSWRPDNSIGLAISAPPSSRNATPTQRLSRLLPAKPALSIAIPKVSTPSPPPGARQQRPLPQIEVQGVATPPAAAMAARALAPQLPAPQPVSPFLSAVEEVRPTQPAGRTDSAQMRQLTAPPAHNGNMRDSAMTEFEEDGRESGMTAPIWRPPSALISSDPQSATTYYVADKYGNWVLGDPKTLGRRMSQAAYRGGFGASGISGSSEAPVVSPLTATAPTRSERDEAALAAAVSALTGASAAAATSTSRTNAQPSKDMGQPGLAPAAEITRGAPPLGDISRSSSVYSQYSIMPPRNTDAPPVPPIPIPASLSIGSAAATTQVAATPVATPASQPLRGRSNSNSRPGPSANQPFRRPSQPKRSDSRDSATTIESSNGAYYDLDDIISPEEGTGTMGSMNTTYSGPFLDPSSLSPVVESPNSGGGRSPVAYPRIPGTLQQRRMSVTGGASAQPATQSSLRLVPPPKRFNAYMPPGQPSPTLGILGMNGQPAPREPGYMASYSMPRRPDAQVASVPGPVATATGSGGGYRGVPNGRSEQQSQAYNYRSDAAAPSTMARRPDPSAYATGSPTMRMVSASPPPGQPAQQGQQPPPSQPQVPYQSPSRNRLPAQPSPADWRPPFPLAPQTRQLVPAPLQPAPRPQQQPQPQKQYQALPPPLASSSAQSGIPPQGLARPSNQPGVPSQAPQALNQSSQALPPAQLGSLPPLQTELPMQPHVARMQSPASSIAPSLRTMRTNSAASSLLAKRLGSDRAAALALPANSDAMAAQKWRRQQQQLLSAGVLPSPGFATGQLPATPTWQPKLTPTRRGDDLFLNVQ